MKHNKFISFQKVLSYFFKKGKKSKVETQTRLLFKQNSFKTRKGIIKQTEKSIRKAVPYIRVLKRKRGKKIKYKVTYLEKDRGVKKSFLFLAKVIRENKTTNPLSVLIRDIKKISLGKSEMSKKIKKFHKLAYRRAPKKWRWKKRKWFQKIKYSKIHPKFFDNIGHRAFWREIVENHILIRGVHKNNNRITNKYNLSNRIKDFVMGEQLERLTKDRANRPGYKIKCYFGRHPYKKNVIYNSYDKRSEDYYL